METARYIIFRELTDADFFNINKPRGTERGGGGQSYIDISTTAVSLGNWRAFFHGAVKEVAGIDGPAWEPNLRSLGVARDPQPVKIAQRRDTTVAIRSQKLGTRASNRVHAWRPDLTHFPSPATPSLRGHIDNLRVYIVRLSNDEYWAGWFQKAVPEPGWQTNAKLNRMFSEPEGFLTLRGDVSFDPATPDWPFRVATTSGVPASAREAAGSIPLPATKAPATSPMATDSTATGVSAIPSPADAGVDATEDSQTESFFDEDEIAQGHKTPEVREAIQRIRVRDRRAVRRLKELYGSRCQVTGEANTFLMRNGRLYSEVHHLIPLGQGGADSLYNMVVLSPVIHRMFHFARVEGLELSKIEGNKLKFKMNTHDYEITWHPDHAKIVEGSL